MSKQNPTRPFKGMITDSSPLDQPKGSYTMAWNAMNEASDGENNFLSNEQSNESCGEGLTGGYTPIGDIYISDGNTVIFSTNGTNSEIGIIDSECNYVWKVNTPCLGFKITNQIDAVFRVRRGCERVIYFTDGVNPVRFYNFETPTDFEDSVGAIDCELFKLFLDFNQPDFKDFEIKEQGALRSGTYSFAIQYIDKDLNPTAWGHVSLPIPIFQADLNGNYTDITGSSNSDVDSLAGTGNQTNKSITIELDNLDTNYEYYRFAVIAATSSTGEVTDVYASYEISTTENKFIYGGNIEGFTKITLSEVIIAPIDIDSAQHIEQLENKLILANIKGKQVNYCDFQSYASRISSKYVVQTGPASEIGNGNPKTPSTYWFSKGYMGDEVYAFGIVYVFGDGTESPAYHIPGRSILDPATCTAPCVSTGPVTYSSIELLWLIPTSPNPSFVTSFYIEYTDSVSGTQSVFVNIPTPITAGQDGWITAISTSTSTISSIDGIFKDAALTDPGVNNNFGTAMILAEINLSMYATITNTTYNNNGICADEEIATWSYNLAHIIPSDQAGDYNSGAIPKLQRWQVYNTAKALSVTEGYMAFWECESSTYPSLLNCGGGDYWGNDICGNPLVSQKVRHHKFPDRNLVEHIMTANDDVQQCQTDIYMLIDVLSCTGGTGVTVQDIKTMFGAAQTPAIAWDLVTAQTQISLYVDVTIGSSATTTEVVTIEFGTFFSNMSDPDGSAGCTAAGDAKDWEPFIVFIGSFTSVATGGPPPTTCDTYTVVLSPTTTTPSPPPPADPTHFPATATSLGIAGPLTYNITINESTTANTTTAGVNGLVQESSTGLIQSPTGLQVKNLGIEFDNIRYPHKDIVGHYIVRGERDDFNRTVISKGFTTSLMEDTQQGTQYYLAGYLQGGWWDGQVKGRVNEFNYVVTPKALFADNPPKGAYIKQEQLFNNTFAKTQGNNWNWDKFDNLTWFGAGPGKSAAFNFGGDNGYVLGTRKIVYTGVRTTPPAVKIRPILKNLSMNGLAYDTDFADTTTNERLLYNLSHTNKAHIINIPTDLSLPVAERGMHGGTGRDMPYISLKIDREVHPNLENIKYFRTHNSSIRDSNALNPNSLTPSAAGTYGSNTVFGGDIIIGEMNYGNTMLYNISQSVTASIALWAAAIVIVITSVVITIFTYGAGAPSIAGAIVAAAILTGASITLTAVTIAELAKHILQNGLDEILNNDTEFSGAMYQTKSAWWFANEFLEDIYIESEFNLGLRQDHSGYGSGNFNRSTSFFQLQQYFRDKIMYWNPNNPSDEKDKWLYRETPIPEIYHYNLDFSKINNENVYMSLPASWDCCSDCVDQHPTRIHHSQQSFQEENTDNFRIFLANDYKDIEGEKGEITNIFRKSNSLYIHTEESLWLLPQNVQERITGEFLSFIGTGEYFSIPPRLIQDDEIGTTGTRHKWATIKTDAGIFFIDEASKGIYLIGAQKGLTKISDRGMKADFKKMLIPYFCEQYYVKTGFHFPNKNNPANPHGVGYHVVYDTKYNRVIFTKRDYLIDEAYIEYFSIVAEASGSVPAGLTQGWLIFSTYNNYFATVDADTAKYTKIAFGLGNNTYFEDKSWTISYDLINNSWTSMHSYLPIYYYYIHDKFYSFKNSSNNIYKHNKVGHYQTFYSVLYPHIIEYVSLSSPVMTRIWDEVMLQVVARVYDVVKQQYSEVSDDNTRSDRIFNKAIFYNSTQCSGELNLTIKDNDDQNYLVNQILDSAANFITISRDERNWKLNEIRDYRSNYTKAIWTEQWSSISSEYPIDKVLNTATIDFDKIWTDLQLLRDKYLIIRLIFDNFSKVNLITNYSFERETPSIR